MENLEFSDNMVNSYTFPEEYKKLNDENVYMKLLDYLKQVLSNW